MRRIPMVFGSTPNIFILAMVAIAFVTTPSFAQTNYFWNGGTTGANPAAGGTGTWSTTNAWRTVTSGGSQGTWLAGTQTHNGFLEGTAGTITLGTSGSTNFSGTSLTVNTTGYTITTSSSGRNLALTGSLTLSDGVELTLTNSGTGGNLNTFGTIGFGSASSLVIQGGASANNANRVNLTSTTAVSGGSITLAGTGAGLSGFASVVSIASGGAILNTNITNNSSTSATMFGATSGNMLTYGGVLSGSANLQVSAGPNGGAGITVLTNTNTFTGNTYLNSGTNSVLRIGVTNALPTGTTIFFGQSSGGGTTDTGGSIDLNGNNLSVGSLDGGAATRGIANNTTTLATLTVGKTSGSNTFAGTIGTVSNTNLATQSTNIAVNKTGASTQIFSGANTYSGGTTISAGTLVAANTTGSATGSGAITVSGTGVLSGGTGAGTTIGSVTGATNVQTGGTIRADSGSGTNTLAVGNVSIQNGGTLLANIAATNNNSTLAVGGNVLDFVTGSRVGLVGQTGFTSVEGGPTLTYNLATLSSGSNIRLDGNVTGVADGFVFGEYVHGTGNVNSRPVFIDTTNFGLTLNTDDRLVLRRTGNNLVLQFSPVPEPTTILGVAVGLVAVGGFIRKRLAKKATVAA